MNEPTEITREDVEQALIELSGAECTLIARLVDLQDEAAVGRLISERVRIMHEEIEAETDLESDDLIQMDNAERVRDMNDQLNIKRR